MPLLHSPFSLFLVGLGFKSLAIAQSQSVQFNQVVNLNGDMQLNTITFPDNSKIETFSQSQRQLLVNQNPAPLTANHVIGSTGQPFVQLSQNSMTISTNGATDLVGAQIELPIPQAALDQNGVTADNTFVAKLSPDGQAWMVMEGIKSVNTTDSTVRLVKMTNIDGEYMAIGRKTVETSNVLTPFAGPSQRSVNITGTGFQEVEFADGFRMSIRANMPMTVSTDVVNGVSSSMLTNNMMPVNNFRYLVTTNLAGVAPNLNKMLTVIQVPLNANKLMATAMSMGIGLNDSISLGIAQRGVLQNPGGATKQGGLQPQKRQKARSSSVKTSKVAASTKVSKSVSESAAAGTESASAAKALGTSVGAAEASATSVSGNSTEASASSSGQSSFITSSSVVSDKSAASTPAPTQAASNQPSATQNQNQNPAAVQLLLSPTFTPVNSRAVLDTANSRVAVPVSQLDGEFILTMVKGTPGAAQAEAQTGGISMTMAEVRLMAQQQLNMGVMPVLQMMQEFMNQSQNQEGASQASTSGEKYRRTIPRRISPYFM